MAGDLVSSSVAAAEREKCVSTEHWGRSKSEGVLSGARSALRFVFSYYLYRRILKPGMFGYINQSRRGLEEIKSSY